MRVKRSEDNANFYIKTFITLNYDYNKNRHDMNACFKESVTKLISRFFRFYILYKQGYQLR